MKNACVTRTANTTVHAVASSWLYISHAGCHALQVDVAIYGRGRAGGRRSRLALDFVGTAHVGGVRVDRQLFIAPPHQYHRQQILVGELARFFFESSLFFWAFFNCLATTRRSFRMSKAFFFKLAMFAAQLSGVRSETISAMFGALIAEAAEGPAGAVCTGDDFAATASLPASMTGIPPTLDSPASTRDSTAKRFHVFPRINFHVQQMHEDAIDDSNPLLRTPRRRC